MTDVPTTISAITLFVADVAEAKAFYVAVFGIPVFYEDADSAVFRFGDTLVNLLVNREADDLVAPAPVAGAEAGVRFQLTITVPDVDEAATELVLRGATLLNGPMDRPWGIRTACFRDPGGHVWEIAH